MVSQLGFQATLQSCFQQAVQPTVVAGQRHLTGTHLLENAIHRTRSLQPTSQLLLPRAPLGTLPALGHTHSSVSSQMGSHCLHKRSDTSLEPVIFPAQQQNI